MKNTDDERDAKIGRTLFTLTYWLYAMSVIAPATVVAGIVLFIFGKSLWFAPLCGLAVWFFIKGIRRLVFRILLFFSKY